MLSSVGVLAIGAGAAFGQQPGTAPVELDPVVVSAPPLGFSRSDLVEGTTVLEGDALEARRAVTVGESLERTPGVRSSWFGPGAGRPIVRGQGGPRVRVLSNGLDGFDASGTSPDHAVAAPVGPADRIEVLRGPSTLLYGSGAIGGVVNVIDGRIPERLPPGFASGSARLGYGSGAREFSGYGGVDANIAGKVGLHIDTFADEAKDYRIKGYASEAAREAGIKGRVDNSFVQSRGGSVGSSWIGDWGFAGVSFSRFETRYGIPSGGHAHGEAEGEEEHDHDHAHEAERVKIDLRQSRYDAKIGLTKPFAFAEEIRARVGYADYQHKELEGDAVGTTFKNKSWETRIEMVHAPIGPVRGVLGVQSGRRDFEAIGEEAFLPPTVTDNHAAFFLERWEVGPWLLVGGGRLERQTVEATSLGRERRFNAVSVSGSATYRLSPQWSLGLAISRMERGPTAEELFSNGPHLATGSFEIGDPDLRKETALHAELSLKKRRGDVRGGINLFATRYKNFIFQDFTGAVEDGLDVLRYRQADADFRGIELEAAWTFARGNGWALTADGQLDFVWAENRTAGSPLPRIPPVGYVIGMTAEIGDWALRGEVVGATKQDRTGPNETETGGYTFLNAGVTWRPFPDSDTLVLTLQGRNLTDEVGRSHVSLLKDVAPLRGREVRLGGQVRF